MPSSWIARHLRIAPPSKPPTFGETLAVVRADAAEAERSRLARAQMTGRAIEQNITATEILDRNVAAAKAQARTVGAHDGRGFAEIEAAIELAVEDGLRDARRG